MAIPSWKSGFLIIFFALLAVSVGSVPVMEKALLHKNLAHTKVAVRPEKLLRPKGYQEYNWQPRAQKRTTMLLNKLMTALNKAMDEEDGDGIQASPRVSEPIEEEQLDLRRRTNNGKGFLQCYFNAVTCF